MTIRPMIQDAELCTQCRQRPAAPQGIAIVATSTIGHSADASLSEVCRACGLRPAVGRDVEEAE